MSRLIRRQLVLCAAALAAIATQICAQPHSEETARLPAFEVAAIRPNSPADLRIGFWFTPDGISVTGAPLQMILGEAFHADGNKIGRQTIHTAGSAIGGWSGAFAVAAGGAEVGAAIGLLGGPVGSAVGGVVGGLFGGILGSFGGSAFGEHVADDLAK